MDAYQRFIAYAELDQKIDRLQQERSTLSKKSEQITHQRNSFLEMNQTLCRNAHLLRKELDLLELELKAIAQKITQKERALVLTGSVKEYTALQHEVENLTEQHASLEEAGLKMIDRWEEAQKVCRQVETEQPAQLQEFDEDLEKVSKRTVEVDALTQAYKAQQLQEQKELDPDQLALYNNMKEKVANPVVPLINGQCSACFFTTNPKDAVISMHGGLVRCKDCYRFLYTHQPIKKNDE